MEERLSVYELDSQAKRRTMCSMLAPALTESQRDTVINRLAVQLPRILRSGLSEEEMRKAIGRQVHGDITDLLEPLYGYTVPKVVPSILPPHDDTTIGRLANTQRALRRSDLSPESQALVLDEVERIELWIQKEDRPPRPPPSIFDGEPQVSYFIQ